MARREKKCLHEIKKLLECPVCYQVFPKNISMCLLGHHICECCRRRTHECPVCKEPYSKARNFFAEHVACVLRNKRRRRHRNKSSAMIQYPKLPSLQNVFYPLNMVGYTLDRWGIFPCQINDMCGFKGCYSDILQHIHEFHRNVFETCRTLNEMPLTYEIQYENDKNWAKAFYVKKWGLFVLRAVIDDYGVLTAYVIMYGSVRYVKKFNYTMDITCFRGNGDDDKSQYGYDDENDYDGYDDDYEYNDYDDENEYNDYDYENEYDDYDDENEYNDYDYENEYDGYEDENEYNDYDYENEYDGYGDENEYDGYDDDYEYNGYNDENDYDGYDDDEYNGYDDENEYDGYDDEDNNHDGYDYYGNDNEDDNDEEANDNTIWTHSGRIYNCRTPKQFIKNNSLCIPWDSVSSHIGHLTFQCSIHISYN